MATRSATVVVPVGLAAALEACRQALSAEVWELEENGPDRIVANEWPWRISCRTRPARIQIRIDSAAGKRTELRLDASAPGFGPIVGKHLADHLEGLEQRIRDRAVPRNPRGNVRPSRRSKEQ
jgi:hypothetical protein